MDHAQFDQRHAVQPPPGAPPVTAVPGSDCGRVRELNAKEWVSSKTMLGFASNCCCDAGTFTHAPSGMNKNTTQNRQPVENAAAGPGTQIHLSQSGRTFSASAASGDNPASFIDSNVVFHPSLPRLDFHHRHARPRTINPDAALQHVVPDRRCTKKPFLRHHSGHRCAPDNRAVIAAST